MTPLDRLPVTAWGTDPGDVPASAAALAAAAALVGMPVDPVDPVDAAAAVALAELACQTGRCRLSTAVRGGPPVTVAVSRAVRLAAGRPVATFVAVGGTCTDAELAWVEGLTRWAEHVGVDPAAVLARLAAVAGDLDGPIGRVAAACDDLTD